MKKTLIILLMCCVTIPWAFPVLSCTTMIAGKNATSDGSIIVAHSDDNDMADQRIVYVPARDYPEGAMRNVYYDPCSLGANEKYNDSWWCRYAGPDRGPAYVDLNRPQSIPLGSIPQVSHTYAYFDGDYGIMNEHQLMFGECTDGVKTTVDPEPGKRIFYSAELSRVALERCRTARDAIRLMGELIETYGYYGTGETLPVGDTEEAWVMEMAPSPSGIGGLWVAKRVPDGEIFVAANEFRIREIDPDDPDVMYSKDLHRILQEKGWWNPAEGTLDWLKAITQGEYNHPYYSLRRVWRLLSLIAPSRNFTPWVEDGFTKAYPFSVKPDKKLSVRDVMNLYRDHYEGTEFDMTKGIAAGPFGFPNRFYGPYESSGDVGDPTQKREGAWERPLSVVYCGYTQVCQARSRYPDPIGGIMWIGLDKPAETCFVPFYAGITAMSPLFETCDVGVFSKKSAWWAFNFVANWAQLKYSYMIHDIKEMQYKLETRECAALKSMDSRAEALYKDNPDGAVALLTEFCVANAAAVVAEWWNFSEGLIVKYSDGFINKNRVAERVGYPRWWREAAGWHKGPTEYRKQ